MSVGVIGLLGVAGLLLLIFARVPIAIALAVSGFLGSAALDGWSSALKMMGLVPYQLASAYSLSVVPLFVLMGLLVAVAGIGRDTFEVAAQVFRRVLGGLGIATVAANAVFAAITGISIASAAVPASATTWKVSRRSSSATSPCRTTSWSSTTRSRRTGCGASVTGVLLR